MKLSFGLANDEVGPLGLESQTQSVPILQTGRMKDLDLPHLKLSHEEKAIYGGDNMIF
ncbi:MAG: hypothetical protein ACK4UR_02215 [Caldimicrobium sp.]